LAEDIAQDERNRETAESLTEVRRTKTLAPVSSRTQDITETILANRSYLYSTNRLPDPSAAKEDRKIVGLSEQGFDIPVVYRLLLSGSPQVCRSVIWEGAGDVAIAGDYEMGVAALKRFLSRITNSAAEPLVRESIEFLEKAENKNSYFLLECAEIFDMQDANLVGQNADLLKQIQVVARSSEKVADELNARLNRMAKPASLLARLLGRAADPAPQREASLQALCSLGLGNWSNDLYFSFDAADQG
jgi:hypothetical protein